MRTYGAISLDSAENRWVISACEPHVAIKMKQLFPRIPRSGPTPYNLDNTLENCRELEWFLTRYPFEISDDDLSYMCDGKLKQIAKMEELDQILKPEYIPRTFPLKKPLREYQAVGVELYLAHQRLLNGDETGLGKTVEGIASFCDPRTLPAVVVCQTHLPTQWKNEIGQFTDLKVHVIKGTKPYSLPPADVYILKYSCLAGWVDTYSMGIFKSVVFDEVQELRRSESAKYQGGKALAESVQFALGLSATPIYNFGDEIFNILNLLKDGCLGEWSDFQREWCGWSNQVKNPKALGAYLRENHLFIRRTRAEAGRELPPVNKIVYTVDHDEKEVEKVEDVARMLAIRTRTGSFVDRGQAARELDLLMRHATGVSKAKSVAAYIRVLLESGESVLLAGWHRDVYDIWLKELKEYNPLMYTGSESPAQKEKTKQAFIDGESKLMIISLRSGIGLDGLQKRCSIVAFGELDWSPQVHHQVTSRVDRDGQPDQVTAIYLVSEYGSDPVLTDLLALKSSQSRDIIDPNNCLEVQHSDESRIKLLADRVLQKSKPAHADCGSLVKEDLCHTEKNTSTSPSASSV